MAYFLTDNNSTKGRDPNINIINGIHHIKGKPSVNILASNYTNKHITFNEGEYDGHLEPTFTDDTTIDQSETHLTNSVTLQKIWLNKWNWILLIHPTANWRQAPKTNLMHFKEFKTQFAKDETSIGMTPLIKMIINTGNSDPVFQKPYPIAMKNYQWVKEEIEKLLAAKVIHSSRSSWSAPIIVVPKRWWRKMISHRL